MPTSSRHVRMLASVTGEDEARLAADGGADLIDCKDPASGALGALPHGVVRRVREVVPASIPVSATIGDLPPVPEVLFDAAMRMAATGADYVKIGFFPGEGARDAIRSLSLLAMSDVRLVGLLLADRDPDFSLIADMAQAGFAGVMLDTAGKTGQALPGVASEKELMSFIGQAHAAGLFAGLAGSLSEAHISALLPLGPDLLGFRGALCRDGARTGKLDAELFAAVRCAIPLSAPRPARTTQSVGVSP